MDNITFLVSSYEEGEYMTKERLVAAQRELSSLNYHLTVVHLDYRHKFNAVIHNRDGASVASAKARAEHEIPEVDYTRKIMDAIEKVLISMSMEIKIMNNEG